MNRIWELLDRISDALATVDRINALLPQSETNVTF